MRWASLRTFAVLACAAAVACAPRSRAAGSSAPPDVSAPDRARIAAEAERNRTPGPLTRAERSAYQETSRYADVVAFLDSLVRQAPGVLAAGEIGRTTDDRAIPYVIASRPLVRTPEEARRLGRPIVYVQGNIHAGEVEGKEALLTLLRDLVREPGPDVLDSLVLIAVPIYNADGNERLASQSVNRRAQNGPELVGRRPNARDLDLNRDYMKVEAPETRASLVMFRRWDPDVFMDLHTTDGSYHGYALTYAGSLTPSSPFGAYTRDTLLPELRRRVRARHGFETFDYGNFDATDENRDLTDTVKKGWYSYDHRPRFGTNYYGLRGRVSILSEAYSHDPFERRVRATYAFVREALSLVAERRVRICRDGVDDAAGTAGASSAASAAATCLPHAVGDVREIAVRSEITRTPASGPVIAEDLVRTGDSSVTEPGVPRGLRRTGRFRTQRMPVYDRFTPALVRATPAAYLLSASDTAAVRLLEAHGVRIARVGDASSEVEVRGFVVDSVVRAARPFQGHSEVRLAGRWSEYARRAVAPGTYVVPTAQPLGRLAAYLLEPESDDGLVAWNVFDRVLQVGAEFPVLAARSLPAVRR